VAEKSLWAYLKRGMRPLWEDGRRHEDSLGFGISDVSYYHYGNNWIELKEVKKLPARASTGITLGQWHKNDGAQRRFLIKRRGWLLVRVNYPNRMYLLFQHGNLPPYERPYWTWKDMRDNAYYIWKSAINFEMLAKLIDLRNLP
jgi:hypothetical protein